MSELPSWSPADGEALEMVREAGLATELPPPSFLEYAVDVWAGLLDWLVERLARFLPEGLAAETVVLAASYLLVTVALAVVGVLAWRLGGSWLAARRAEPRRPAVDAAREPAAAPVPPAAWLGRLGDHLAAGRLRQALEALWWWTATSLDPSGLDPSWTTGELLAASGRSDLGGELGELDRMLFGGASLDRGRVESVAAAVRRKLGGGSA